MSVGRGVSEPTSVRRDAAQHGVAAPGKGAVGAILAEGPMSLRCEKATGVAYKGPGQDGTHIVSLYDRKRNHLRDITMGVGQRTMVDGMEITLNGPGEVSVRYLS